jgi:AcrR family transcriptional regulator
MARGDSERTLSALAAIRSEPLDQTTQARRAMELAALEGSGQAGYRALTVQLILDRSRVSRNSFYKAFADKADCYMQGYAMAIERLAADILGECETAPDWLTAFRAALAQLERFIEVEPDLAKGLLAEVHVAGGAAMAKRKEVFERLARAIDRARRETSGSRHSPPPITASFILNAIEAAVVRSFFPDPPTEFADSIPDLLYIAVSVYFGEKAAREAIERS